MNQIGRKIYYEVATGNVILNTGERVGFVEPTSIEQDVETYKILSARNRETFDVIELEYGLYAQDFAECIDFRVNIETKQIEFSYPDPNIHPEEQEPVYQKPLSEQLKAIEATILEMSTYSANQDERLATQEQTLLELTTLVAGGNA